MTNKKFSTNAESVKLVSFKELNNGDVFIGGSQQKTYMKIAEAYHTNYDGEQTTMNAVRLGTGCLAHFSDAWTDVEEVFMRIEQESLPSRLCFLSDISKIFAHVRVDYSVTEHGKTMYRYNDTLLTPLRSNCILEALRGSLMRGDDGYPCSFRNKCFFKLFNEFFDREYGHCVPFPEIKFYMV